MNEPNGSSWYYCCSERNKQRTSTTAAVAATTTNEKHNPDRQQFPSTHYKAWAKKRRIQTNLICTIWNRFSSAQCSRACVYNTQYNSTYSLCMCMWVYARVCLCVCMRRVSSIKETKWFRAYSPYTQYIVVCNTAKLMNVDFVLVVWMKKQKATHREIHAFDTFCK